MTTTFAASAAAWRLQIETVRRAIAELGPASRAGRRYGDDLALLDDQFILKPLIDHQISQLNRRDGDWLRQQCSRVPGVDPASLYRQLVEAVTTKQDSELESGLVDTLGFDHLDLVTEIISSSDELREQLQNHQPVVPEPDESEPILTRAEHRARINRQREAQDERMRSLPMHRRDVDYPHVYRQAGSAVGGNVLSAYGTAYRLPAGSAVHDYPSHEECVIPAGKPRPTNLNDPLVRISALDGFCQMTFPAYDQLNRMQSLVYPIAYKTSENMLICAPTGAGKTDAAILTILGVVRQFVTPNPVDAPSARRFDVDKSNVKIIYVAPMKALAAEVADKLGRRFAWLGLRVRELTGDMQLSRAEISQTEVIVTTPEKWDVVTRKSAGDDALVGKVRLLIIDEVHMLHDERGAVLESLVARTRRQVESSQQPIRIVGLSATLPNYIDVADFLGVNRMVGMFYFDGSFRPVPLEQHFVGIKGKARSRIYADRLDQVTHDTVIAELEAGPERQVMVFVHSRKDTVAAAHALLEKAGEHGTSSRFDVGAVAGVAETVASGIRAVRNRDLRELANRRIGIHHAGMSRPDRAAAEKLFGSGALEVLFCTATLAWGVNLPAAAVIIKGTQLYNPAAGKYVDLGILDVVQVFGRAGRPQFQTTGVGYILTSHDRLAHYVSTVTQQTPIESTFSAGLRDNLNAEISLGTVRTVAEAVNWLGYSFMFVRMRRNPAAYGIAADELADDPELVGRRRQLIEDAARALQTSDMAIFRPDSSELRPAEIGRVASQFYVSVTTMGRYLAGLHSDSTEADVFAVLAGSDEFDQVRARDSEEAELRFLRDEFAACEVAGPATTPAAKANILLQAYISRARPEDVTLNSDMAYVAQNGARLCRALGLVAMHRRWGRLYRAVLGLAVAIDRQVWPFEHPVRQFVSTTGSIATAVRALDQAGEDADIALLRNQSRAEIDKLVGRSAAPMIMNAVRHVPAVELSPTVAPESSAFVRVRVQIRPLFTWADRVHGMGERLVVWVEQADSAEMLDHRSVWLRRGVDSDVELAVPVPGRLPDRWIVRSASDRWLGADALAEVDLSGVVLPVGLPTQLVPASVGPVSGAAVGGSVDRLDGLQAMLAHPLRHGGNVFAFAVRGSGLTTVAEAAFQTGRVVYVARPVELIDRADRWKSRYPNVSVTTPEAWEMATRAGLDAAVDTVVLDGLDRLDPNERAAVESVVCRIRQQESTQPRLIGLAGLTNSAADLAAWLAVPDSNRFLFGPDSRPEPVTITVEGFSGPGPAAMLATMGRAVGRAVLSGLAAVFAVSPAEARGSAAELVRMRAADGLVMEQAGDIVGLSDSAARDAAAFGVGLVLPGMATSDRSAIFTLFAASHISVIVASGDDEDAVARISAPVIVVKGTFQRAPDGSGWIDAHPSRVASLVGRARGGDSAQAIVLTDDRTRMYYQHFLALGVPVESSLVDERLDRAVLVEMLAGRIKSRNDVVDWLMGSYFARRLLSNPAWYGLMVPTKPKDEPKDDESKGKSSGKGKQVDEEETINPTDQLNQFLLNTVTQSIDRLVLQDCAVLDNSTGTVSPTALGRISGRYSVSVPTIGNLAASVRAWSSTTGSDPKPGSIIALIARSSELNLPVRRKDGEFNRVLATVVSEPVNAITGTGGVSLEDQRVKPFLLVQTIIQSVRLPAHADVLTDASIVRQQGANVANALVDVGAEIGSAIVLSSILKIALPLVTGNPVGDGDLKVKQSLRIDSLGRTIDVKVDGIGFVYAHADGKVLALRRTQKSRAGLVSLKVSTVDKLTVEVVSTKGSASVEITIKDPAV